MAEYHSFISVNTKEWFNAKELAGVAGLPNSANSVSRKATLEKWEKRQRKGVKGVAYEYHLSSLPADTRASLSEQHISAPGIQLKPYQIDDRLISALGLLTPQEQAAAVEIIRVAGIVGLMPALVSREKALEALGFNLQQLRTFEVLQKLPSDVIKEILSEYENTEQNSPVAPDKEPHKKIG